MNVQSSNTTLSNDTKFNGNVIKGVSVKQDGCLHELTGSFALALNMPKEEDAICLYARAIVPTNIYRASKEANQPLYPKNSTLFISENYATDKFFKHKISKLQNLNKGEYNIYFTANGQGLKKKDINYITCIYIDIDKDKNGDEIPKEEQFNTVLNMMGIEPTVVLDTGGKSLHFYYVLQSPVPKEQGLKLIKDFIEFIPNADPACKDESRILRLPGFKHQGTGKLSYIYYQSNNWYTYEHLRSIIPASKGNSTSKNKKISGKVNFQKKKDENIFTPISSITHKDNRIFYRLEDYEDINSFASDILTAKPLEYWNNRAKEEEAQNSKLFALVTELVAGVQANRFSEEDGLKVALEYINSLPVLDDTWEWDDKDVYSKWERRMKEKCEYINEDRIKQKELQARTQGKNLADANEFITPLLGIKLHDYDSDWEKFKKSFAKEESPCQSNYADFFSSKIFKNRILLEDETGDWYFCQNNIWIKTSQGMIEKVIYYLLKYFIPNRALNLEKSLFGFFKRSCTIESLNHRPTNGIVFANGILNTLSSKLEPLAPERLLTRRLPIDYAPDISNNLIYQDLLAIADGDELVRDMMLVWLLAALRRQAPQKKILVLVGNAGDNGKSTYLNLINFLIDMKFVKSADAKDFNASNRFGLEGLETADHLTLPDVDRYISSMAILKKLSGGDPVTIDRKGVKAVSIVFKGLITLASNHNLKLGENGSAVQKRMVYLPLNADFSNVKPKRQLIKFSDNQWYGEWVNSEAVTGLINLLLSLPGDFVATTLEKYNDYLGENIASLIRDNLGDDPTTEFILKTLRYCPGEELTNPDIDQKLYQIYEHDLNSQINGKPRTKHSLKIRVGEILIQLKMDDCKQRRRRIDGTPTKYYPNITLDEKKGISLLQHFKNRTED